MYFAKALLLLLTLVTCANARDYEFRVSCRKRFVDNQLQINCNSDGQSITKVTYSLNSGSKREVMKNKLPISIPASDLREGDNTIDLVITGNMGTEYTTSLVATKPTTTVPPNCKMSRSGTFIIISCEEGSVEIAYYKYYINREEVGKGPGLSIEIDTTDEAFQDGDNIIMVILFDANKREVDRKTFTLTITRQIDLYFINDTPVLVGGTVTAQFTADRDGLVYQCHLTHFHDSGFREDCSSGEYNETGMPHGDYTLRVIATDPIRGDRQVIRSRLWVHSDDANDPFCILYLRNRGWRVVKDVFVVEFAGTGLASRADAEFECILDRTTPVPCSSPYVLTGLSPGVHHVRIRPTTCGRDYHVWNKRFTVV